MTASTIAPMKLLLVSTDSATLASIAALLSPLTDVIVQRRVITDPGADPLAGQSALPDALLLHLGSSRTDSLKALASRPTQRRPPVIVIGSLSNAADLRLAMQAGARDMLPEPLIAADLLAAVARIRRDRRPSESPPEANITAFINAKGGCGSTLLACNVAHAQASLAGRRVALLDLDLQFGAIPIYFDLFPKRGIVQALENIDGLDETALSAYMARHESGLDILASAAEDPLPLDADIRPERIRRLLELLMQQHDHVVVDLPRRIDPATRMIFERAHRIALVVQQSVAVLRDASRLISTLRRELSISSDRIVTVVNRYDKRVTISPDDIRRTLSITDLSLIPNDYPTVSASIDTGSPLLVYARWKAITKSIVQLQERLDYGASSAPPGFFARTLSQLIPLHQS